MEEIKSCDTCMKQGRGCDWPISCIRKNHHDWQPKPDKLDTVEVKEIQRIIDEADCNAEVNFTDSKHRQRILGWAIHLITIAKRQPKPAKEETMIIKCPCQFKGTVFEFTICPCCPANLQSNPDKENKCKTCRNYNNHSCRHVITCFAPLWLEYQPKSATAEKMPLVDENPDTPGSAGWFANEELKEAQRDADREWHDEKVDKLNKRIQHLKEDCQLLFSKVEYLEAENDRYKARLLEEAETLTAIMNISPKEIFKHIAKLRKEAGGYNGTDK